MTVENDGTDEGTAQPTEAPVDQTQNQEASGIEKRIAELTAARYEEKGRADALAAQLAAAIAGQAQAAKPAPVDEKAAVFAQLEQVSPDVAAAVRRLTELQAREFEAQLSQTRGYMEMQQGSAEIANEAAAAGVKNTAVVARANELLKSWRAAGLKFLAGDALKFAAGEFAMNPNAQKARAPNGQYAPEEQVLTQASIPRQAAPKGAKPRNFDDLPYEQQLQWFDANGVGDQNI